MTLKERKRVMVEYLKLKLHEEDWHGVCDAANDLRELEVLLSLCPRPLSEHDHVSTPS